MGVVTVSISTLVAAALIIASVATCLGILVASISRGWAEESKRINESEGE